MSTVLSAGAQPKRKRGHLRVAAIMQAGIELFKEKGYDATTMSEIATRSQTATASLYRFFPSKESLADALLLQYAQYTLGKLAELRERAADMTSDDVAGALVDLRLELQAKRKFAVELADARGGSGAKREQYRRAMREGLAGILRKCMPGLRKDRSEMMATVLLHTLKAMAEIDAAAPKAARTLATEVRELIRVYLASARQAAGK